MIKPVKIYTPLLRYERILFAILDLELPFPVTYRQIGFFFTSLGGIFLLVHMPIFNLMKSWWLINYIFFPFCLTWFFTKFKLDGKSPHQYIWDYIWFKQSAGIYNRYEKAEKPANYQYKTVVTYRREEDTE